MPGEQMTKRTPVLALVAASDDAAPEAARLWAYSGAAASRAAQQATKVAILITVILRNDITKRAA